VWLSVAENLTSSRRFNLNFRANQPWKNIDLALPHHLKRV